ncbi:hypothetical protein AcW1_003135 [Taiwanofungus camphoratus]|nr:hypothetical protein AcW1_003135 [Antrodia cinnamomea]
MFSQNVALFFLIIVSILNLAYLGSYATLGGSLSSSVHHSYSYIAHDHPQTLPLPMSELQPVSMTVEESIHYPLLGIDSDDEWESASSAGYGYVRLGPEDRLFAVTMYHELHCLRMLNLAFSKTASTSAHIRHCLDYLRQGILCSPDLTLEPGHFEEKDFEVERMGSTHTCKDWSAVYPIMDENYYRWKNQST